MSQPIYTNNRGTTPAGPLDGGLDGWKWQAWSGGWIAYGATRRDAVNHLRQKMAEYPPHDPVAHISDHEIGAATS